MDNVPGSPQRKKKVDYEALTSPLNRIPGMDLASVRALLDLGLNNVEDLNGRCPQALYDDLRASAPEAPTERLHAFRMAVYYAETPEPDPALLQPWKWQ